MNERLKALQFQRAFLVRCRGALQIATLFQSLPMVAFFAKDQKSRFVRANEPLLRIMGCKNEWEILGKTDSDFRPHDIAAMYAEEDRRVMRTGHALSRYVQMVPDVGGRISWRLVTKMPLRDARGRVCGVAGAMYELDEVHGVLQPFQRLEPALRHIHMRYGETIETSGLAKLVNLSERQFVRLFHHLIGETPMRYLTRQRIHAACHQLIATDHPAGRVALECGFYDQSAFTHAFRAVTGITPAGYRKRYLGSVTIADAVALNPTRRPQRSVS